MAELDLITFEDIYTAALRRVKGDPNDTETLEKMKEIINTRHRLICGKKKWRFLRITDRSLKIPKKYTTGTVSLVEGSRTVTGVGTAWDATQRGWMIKPNGINNVYRVVSIKSATELIISSPHTGNAVTGGQYKLFQNEIALFPNLEDVDDIRIDGNLRPIRPVGAAVMNQLRQRFPEREGKPEVYTIEGTALFQGPLMKDFVMGYDFLGQGSVRSISFFPQIPDQNYTVHIPYKKKLTTLTAASTEPDIPIQNRLVLLFYALSDWYASNDQTMAAYYQRLGDTEYKEMVSKFLDTDDVVHMYPAPHGKYTHDFLMRTSQTYFDTEG